MTNKYDPFIMEHRVDNAVSALNSLVLYCAEVLPKNSCLRSVVEHVDVKINDVQTHLAETPYSDWVGAPKPVPICSQCAENYPVCPGEAEWLAPRVVGCPTPDHPENPWTYQFVPLCDGCKSDWWGVDDQDRPPRCPPFMPLPDEWVG
jgi:hypothetical protein